MIEQTATAVWNGNLRNGSGEMSGQSGAFSSLPFSFKTRFEHAPGTNPEELIAAAHAGCFSMALSGELEEQGLQPESIATRAAVNLGEDEQGPAVTEVHLKTQVTISGAADQAAFDKAVDNAKKGCPISKLLKADITVEAEMVPQERAAVG